MVGCRKIMRDHLVRWHLCSLSRKDAGHRFENIMSKDLSNWLCVFGIFL